MCWILAVGLIAAQPKPIEAPITEVTVFDDRARVTRTARLSVPAGRSAVRFPDLLPSIIPGSIRAAAKGAAIERFETRSVVRPRALIPKTEALVEKLESLRREIRASVQQTLIEEWESEALRWLVPRLYPDEAARDGRPLRLAPASDWRAALGFVSSRSAAASKRTLELEQRTRALAEEKANIEKELAVFDERGLTHDVLEVTVALESSRAAEARVELSYFVAAASWVPSHELRFDSKKGTAMLMTSAFTSQSSGEDWAATKLRFSTASPAQSIAIPKLTTWTLGEREELIPVARPKTTRPTPPLFPPPEIAPDAEAGAQAAKLAALRARIDRARGNLRRRGTLISELGSPDLERKREEAAEKEKMRSDRRGAYAELESLQVRMIGLRYADPRTLVPHIQPLLTDRGRVTADPRTRQLMVEDIAEVLIKAERLVRVLDVPAPPRGGLPSHYQDAPPPPPAPPGELEIGGEVSILEDAASPPRRTTERMSISSDSGGVFGELFSSSPDPVSTKSLVLVDRNRGVRARRKYGFDAVFDAASKTKIESSGEAVSVPLHSETYSVKSFYEATPSLSDNAYLRAEVTNRSGRPILGGATTIFVDDAFSGEAELATTGPGGQIALPLGADENIRLKRTIVPSTETEGFFSKDDVTTYTVTIEITNHRSQRIQIVVHEPLPISSHEDVEIELGQVSPKPTRHRKADGVLDFELGIAPKGTALIRLTYVLTRPEGFRLQQN